MDLNPVSTLDPTLAAIALLAPVTLQAYVAPAVGGFLILSGACALVDAHLPQPVAGSRWVWPRRLVAFLGHNYRYAANRVPAGLPARQLAVVRAIDAAVAEQQAAAQAPAVPVMVAPSALPEAAPAAIAVPAPPPSVPPAPERKP